MSAISSSDGTYRHIQVYTGVGKAENTSEIMVRFVLIKPF